MENKFDWLLALLPLGMGITLDYWGEGLEDYISARALYLMAFIQFCTMEIKDAINK